MYDLGFYEEETKVAWTSAAQVMPYILEFTGAQTVIDIGCGTGSWARTAELLGCQALGVDHHVPSNQIQCSDFIDHDLINGYPCSGYDLALCLEVAEHLPPESAQPLVRGLSQAGAVLFSAATPGQPGVGHINCQPHEFWHELFDGFTPEHIGPTFSEPVADFYRRNMFLYRRSP